MDLLTRGHLKRLLGVHGTRCVSIYMPAHRKSPQSKQDPIQFKSLLQRARNTLRDGDEDSSTVRKLLGPAEQWLDDAGFWRHQHDGLAVFLTESTQQRFRLPREFDPQVHVHDHFYVNPLLPLLQANGTFYVLAVSQQSCRLFAGDRDAIRRLDDANLPPDLRSALGWWRERALNLHSMRQSPPSRGGGDTAVFHGHYEDTTKEDLAAYFRRIDAALRPALRGESSPLVFAGVDYLFPIYRSINGYAGLHDRAITGNPDDTSPQELHRKSWSIVRPLFEERERRLLDEYSRRAAHETATSDIAATLRAAGDGLVETLIIEQGAQLRGRVDAGGHVDIAKTPEDAGEDLIDRAVRLTLHSSGDVLAVKPEVLSENSRMLALLRAPISAVPT